MYLLQLGNSHSHSFIALEHKTVSSCCYLLPKIHAVAHHIKIRKRVQSHLVGDGPTKWSQGSALDELRIVYSSTVGPPTVLLLVPCMSHPTPGRMMNDNGMMILKR